MGELSMTTYRIITERGLQATLEGYTQAEAEYEAILVAFRQGMTYLQDGTVQDPPKVQVAR
jgi:hypothetical protein